MTFIHPDILYFVWLVPVCVLLFIYGHKRRARIMADYGDAHTLQTISIRSGRLKTWCKHGLLLISLVSIIVALAGLQYGHTWERIERKGVSIVLALDCSRSMLAKDITPDRLERAKWEIRDLLSMLQGDKVGLVAFAGTAFLQCPVTLDYSGFGLFLQALSPDSMPVGGTDLNAAIETAMQAFDPEESSEKAIILITDGEKTLGDPLGAAKKAADEHIKIFCIGIGNPQGAPIPGRNAGFVKDEHGAILLSKLDEQTLRQIAALTGGTYVQSITGDMDLDTIYNQEIRGTMKASTVSGGKKKTSIDRYAWLLCLAVAALFIDLLILCPKNTLFAFLLLFALLTAMPRSARANPFTTTGQKGVQAYENKDYPGARKHFLKAQVDDPDNAELAYDLGNTAYQEGRFEEAQSFFATAAQSNDPKLQHKALYNQGNALFRMKKPEEALKAYDQAATIAPDDQDLKDNITFVKKVLEQQKKQKQQDKQDNKKKKQNQKKDGEKKKQDTNQQQPGEQNKKQDAKGQDDNSTGQSPPSDKKDQNTKEPSKQNQDAQKQSKTPDSIDQKDLPKPEKQQGGSGEQTREKQQDKPAEQSPAQAHDKNMLNRLKDHPGQALMPRYEKRNVEKDW